MSIKDIYKVESIKSKETYDWLLHKHYAKRIPMIMYAFGLFKKKELLGVCTFGQSASYTLQQCCSIKYKNNVLELNRLCINEGLEKNILSYFVSQTFKFFKKPTIIISFSDTKMKHNGYIYQALNFYYTGTGGRKNELVFNGRSMHGRNINKEWFIGNKLKYDKTKTLEGNFILNGIQVVQNKPKNRYIYIIATKKQKTDILKNLKYEIQPYPKEENKRYDANYIPVTQSKLF